MVPLHDTARAGLERYLQQRRPYAPFDDHVFISLRRKPVQINAVDVAFRTVADKMGLPRGRGRRRPTPHSLRHAFAVRALLTCPDGRDRITQHMLMLSTYLGHGKVADTYWYLEAVPELMQGIASRCEAHVAGGAHDRPGPARERVLSGAPDARAPCECQHVRFLRLCLQVAPGYASKRLKTVPSRLELERIDAPLVIGFLNDLEMRRSNSANSRNVRLAAIKSFMHFMEYRVPSALEQIQRVLAIPMKKTNTRLVRHLTGPEIQALLDAPKPTDWAGVRDRAMLHLTFAAALRVSELTGLRLEDLSLHPHASILIHGKGRRERCLPLWKQTTAALRAWLAVRGPVPAPEIFVNARREPMTRAGFEYILEKHVRTATSLPVLDQQAHFAARTEAQLCIDGTGSNQGSAEGLALARAREHADHRDVHTSRSGHQTGSPRRGYGTETALWALPSKRQAHRVSDGLPLYAERTTIKLGEIAASQG